MSSEEVLAWFDSLAVEYAEELDVQDISDNPLYFRLFMPLALYNSAIDDAIVPEQAAATVTDAEEAKDVEVNDTLIPSILGKSSSKHTFPLLTGGAYNKCKA